MHLLGSEYGEFNVNNALRDADALSNHIHELTEESRGKLNEILKSHLKVV